VWAHSTGLSSMWTNRSGRTTKVSFEIKIRIFAQLVKDDTPMVRRSAGNHLHKIVGVLQKSQVISEFVPLLKVLVDDDQVIFWVKRYRIPLDF
jgi:hypothetical protein